MSENLIEFNGISKFFGKVIALKDVTMKVKKGEIMCLLGDNGAGKSTLIKTLSGVHKPDEGEIIVEGNDWELACNSIHFIDLLVFLTEQVTVKFDLVQLDNFIYPSKRNGFKELRGKMVLITERGDRLEILDHDSFEVGLTKISIKTKYSKFTINELDGTMDEILPDKPVVRHKISIPLQSNITGKVADQILETSQSNLTSYAECLQYHIPMLNVFNKHFTKVTGEEVQDCPIT